MRTTGLSILFISYCLNAFPQAQADTMFVTAAKLKAYQRHEEALRPQARLFNGSKYRPPQQTFEQHPYLASEDWLAGSVFYDGEYFQSIPLMYDLLSDALITEHFPSGHQIQLVKDKIDYFSFGSRNFENIADENSLPHSGFYEVLYGGETKVLALRQKIRREKIEVSSVLVTYEERNRYFIHRNGVFFSVKSKSSVLKMMDDRRAELKRFIKEQRIDFAVNREAALKSVAEHYDSLR